MHQHAHDGSTFVARRDAVTGTGPDSPSTSSPACAGAAR